MRKKSHIALAVGLVHGLDLKTRMRHKLSFYIGSLWPDITPSFFTRRHCIDETFELTGNYMTKFLDRYNAKRDLTVGSSFRLGIIMHYIADYFTYPHNTHFPGTLAEHCSYEEVLKKDMYTFIGKVLRDEQVQEQLPVYADVEHVLSHILSVHDHYMTLPGSTEHDCMYSYRTCTVVLASLLLMAENTEIAIAA